jgi:ketosteroid isomerase-like protein
MTSIELDTVATWHAAVNAGDVERLVALSTDDVEVGGPRGAGRGSALLRDWFGRAGIQLEPRRLFARAETDAAPKQDVAADGTVVVVEQSARWRAEDGSLGEPQAAASVFRVRDGRVSSVIRYSDLASALETAGLNKSDAVSV